MATGHTVEALSPDIPDYNIVPGTVYLVQGAHQVGLSSQDIILHPTPSSDPSDPLRWSFWRKTYHLFLLFWYSSIVGAVTNWESVIYLNLMEAYNTTIDQLNIGAAVMILLLGVGNVFFVLLSNKFGRRSVYIWTMLMVVVSQIIMALSKDIRYYQGAHFLLGMDAAPFKALRGSKLSIYVFGLAFGSFIGPICAGYMVETQTWRWVYWWGVLLTGALLILFYLTFEESRFLRSVDPDEGLVVPLPAKSTLDLDDHHTSSVDDSKHDYKVDEELRRHNTNNHTAHVGEVFETTNWSPQFGLWKSYPDSWGQVCREFVAPLSISWFPAVFWCGLNYDTCVSWLSVLATTVAEVFAVPPYNFY
ncbi:hypothetical protein LTR78_007699 [Recurvomyces mirabilis]|uniref:Major facilitator superfamily (MFS) profile domain-containing protein n=1 Tax=Recurvomyces mirabilis TaxID=574656 RepID=A0AAE0WJ82_9PEZI|nr:hypothetical protein LTR78_007699 [Recurvomyces mirabilis]KAK5151586.1 hypothetical protein LTS14_009073 [Recurvomyces mirabilis]